jgi:hypothetical protein
MGLFSKIFGGENEQDPKAPGGEALKSEPRRAVVEGSEAKPSHPASNAAEPNDPPDNRMDAPNGRRTPPHSESKSDGASRGDKGDRKAATDARGNAKNESRVNPSDANGPRSRPSVPAKVEARLHVSPTYSVPSGTTPKKPDAPSPVASNAAVKVPRSEAVPIPAAGVAPVRSATNLVVAAGPPPIPVRGPNDSRGLAPAKKAAETPAVRAEAAELTLEPLAVESPTKKATPERDEIDHAFDRIATAAPGQGGKLSDDSAIRDENARMFREMLLGHARPIRHFMMELQVGSTTRQWFDIAKPAVKGMLEGARALDQAVLAQALGDYERALDVAAEAFAPRIDGAERDRLLTEYRKLVEALPSAFDVKNERDRSEPIVVHQLLLQAPGVNKLAIDKLYAAGLASLDALCRASVEDLIALGRLEVESARAIVERFQSYWRERTAQAPQRAEEQTKQKLRALAEALRRAHEEFERAESDDDRERKRRARSERRSRALELNVVLAQLGEVDLVAELERSPTERRVERVLSYLERGRAHDAA